MEDARRQLELNRFTANSKWKCISLWVNRQISFQISGTVTVDTVGQQENEKPWQLFNYKKNPYLYIWCWFNLSAVQYIHQVKNSDDT